MILICNRIFKPNLKTQFYKRFFLLSLLVLILANCSSNKQVADEANEPTNKVLTFTVVDQKGLSINDVVVSSDTLTLESAEYNAFNQLVVEMPPNTSSGIIKLSKTDYIDGILQFDSESPNLTKQVTLLARGPAITFDGSLGGKFAGKDGAIVDIPEFSLVNSNGDIVFGPVDLYITPLDISDDIEVNAFPGSFTGMPTNQTETELLYSYGVVEYSFFQNGEELQLLSGTQAELELPIYANQHFFDATINVGDTIPLWTLDETSGIWIQQGMGTVVANEYTPTGLALRASTTHFTWFNVDRFNGLNGGTPDPDPDNEGPCNLLVLFEGLLDNSGYELFLNLSKPGYPTSTTSVSFVYSDPQSVATSIPRNVPMSAHVVGPARRAEDGRIVTSESADKEFVCSPGLEEVIITLSLTETEPEFVRWNAISEPVFTKDENGFYEIVSNKVLMGGLFTGTEQVDVSAEIIGFPLSLGNNQIFEAEYQKTPVHSNPTTITATVSNALGTDQIEIQLPFIDSAPPFVFATIAYHQTETSDTLIKWFVEGADAVVIYYINSNGDRTRLGAANNNQVSELVINSIYPNEGSIELTFGNTTSSDVQISTIPIFPANFLETD